MAASIAFPRYLFATVDLRDGVHLVSEEGAFELHYCALLTNEENKCVSAFARVDPGTEVAIRRWSYVEIPWPTTRAGYASQPQLS